MRSGPDQSPRYFWRRDCSYSDAVTTSGPFATQLQCAYWMRNDRNFFRDMWASA